jgi:nucleotide-binding universal stress UspA family protein
MGIFPTTILLATDGSEGATLAARTAIDIADKIGSDLHIVLVGLSVGYVGMGPLELADIPGPAQEELNQEAQRLLNAQARWIKANGGTVWRKLTSG